MAEEAHEELSDLNESAEEGRQPRLAPVSLTMAVLAVLVAITTLLGHRSHTEEIVLQTKSSDQWAYYQAHNMRGYSYEAILDELQFIPTRDRAAEDKAREKYQAALEHERERTKEIAEEARKLEAEARFREHRGDRFDLGEGLLEAGLVITSITLLTRRRGFWYAGCIVAGLGIVAAFSAFFIQR
jgi:hypothetical protein